MKKKFILITLIVVNILAICGFIIWYLNRTYPMIGHDYRLFMPYMIDSYLHQRINGLTVQWYTPSFAGGRPVFSNPQDLQFSLPQFLLWVANPWASILISISVFVTIGFVAMYYFLRKIASLGSLASILGSVFFVANGFYFEHMSAGHVTYQAFPLFAIIVILLTHPRLPAWLAGLLVSLVLTILIYSGIHDIPFFILTAMLFLPILYLTRPSLFNWKRMGLITLWGSVATILVCGSKLSAIIYFMRFFPRFAQDTYTTSLLTGMVGMVHQLLGTMTLAPFYRLLQGKYTYDFVVDLSKATGTLYGYWELDASLSPALLLLLAGGAISFLLHKPSIRSKLDKRRLLAIACLIAAFWLVIEFTLAKGFIYPLIQNLPILSSLRANIRYICAFIFPLAFVGAVIFDNWTKSWKSRGRLLIAFLLLDGIALGALLTYYWVPAKYTVGVRYYEIPAFDYRPIQQTYEEIRYQGATFPIQRIIPDDNPWMVFMDQATNLIDPYNAYFKSLTGYRQVLHAGSVYDIENGAYNIIDPTGYIFPEVNHSSFYERIPATDKDKFLAFINRRQPDWKLPFPQQILDWISPLSLLAVLLTLGIYTMNRQFGWPKMPHRMIR